MCMALAASLLLIWLAYATGQRNGRETAPAHYAFESERLKAEQDWWAETRDDYDPDLDVCSAIIEATRRP